MARYPIFEAKVKNYQLVLETPFTEGERSEVPDGDKRNRTGLRIDFDPITNRYDVLEDPRLKTDEDRSKMVQRLQAYMASRQFTGYVHIYEPGKEQVTLTRDDLDRMIAQKIEAAQKTTAAAGK